MHNLSEHFYDKETNSNWTAFTSLRLAFRSTRSFPIWSLQGINPPPYKSNRIILGKQHNVIIYSAPGFHQVAANGHENMTLEDVVAIPFRAWVDGPAFVRPFMSSVHVEA
jgi:hypothetical protein